MSVCEYLAMPLKGIKVLELAGLAPGPLCGMILADFGASVIRIDKTAASFHHDCLGNGKRSIALNLKNENGIRIFKRMSSNSDVIIDPFRSGVMEKLGLGPENLMKDNAKLIYARLTGYGQKGPFANMAGHDINYVGLSGVLSLFGRSGAKPTPPVNFAADFAGGGLMCALGIILALYERTKSNTGQVIDAAMVEGTAYLGSWLFRSQNMSGLWGNPRGKNILDSGAHFYDTYETKDGRYMCVGAIEPQFYTVLLNKLGISEDEMSQWENFDENKAKLESIFKGKTQEEWCAIFDGTDACVTPMLNLKDVTNHIHNKERQSFSVDDKGTVVPNAAPRMSRTPGATKGLLPQPNPGEHTVEILQELNFKKEEIKELISSGAVEQARDQKSKL